METFEPKMLLSIGILYVEKSDGTITFYSSKDAAKNFEKFGTVLPVDYIKDRYVLYVDSRFSFDEVLEYVRNY